MTQPRDWPWRTIATCAFWFAVWVVSYQVVIATFGKNARGDLVSPNYQLVVMADQLGKRGLSNEYNIGNSVVSRMFLATWLTILVALALATTRQLFKLIFARGLSQRIPRFTRYTWIAIRLTTVMVFVGLCALELAHWRGEWRWGYSDSFIRLSEARAGLGSLAILLAVIPLSVAYRPRRPNAGVSLVRGAACLVMTVMLLFYLAVSYCGSGGVALIQLAVIGIELAHLYPSKEYWIFEFEPFEHLSRFMTIACSTFVIVLIATLAGLKLAIGAPVTRIIRKLLFGTWIGGVVFGLIHAVWIHVSGLALLHSNFGEPEMAKPYGWPTWIGMGLFAVLSSAVVVYFVLLTRAKRTGNVVTLPDKALPMVQLPIGIALALPLFFAAIVVLILAQLGSSGELHWEILELMALPLYSPVMLCLAAATAYSFIQFVTFKREGEIQVVVPQTTLRQFVLLCGGVLVTLTALASATLWSSMVLFWI